jgi:flagellar export protein FliJ
MKSRESLVKLRQFQVNEKSRQLKQLEQMIVDFDRMAADLDAQIAGEEKRAGITDINHFAYPTFARAARTRRENLVNSQRELKIQRDTAAVALGEAQAELRKAEALEERDHGRGGRNAEARQAAAQA